MKIELHAVDYVILCVYFLFVLGIGLALKRYMKTGEDFFMSGRSIPAWVCGLAFISANLGAQEVIGMAASGAKYGIMTSHFYWVGAIPAMVFLAIFMMPFYYGSRARSVPEYLKLRFDEKTRGFNAISFAVMTVFSSGISMYALAKLFELLLGWNFHFSIFVSGVIVLAYIFLGGLTSAIYNEVLQFFLIVLGFLPLVMLGLRDVGGWHELILKLNAVSASKGLAPGAMTHSWAYTGSPTANPMGVEWFGVVFGLGFVLSFGYWCTDFLVVQRAMAANSMSAARRTPLIAAVPKMLFPALVILPGLIAISMHYQTKGMFLPVENGQPNYNMAMPAMLGHYYPAGMLGLGLTALMASFMSGMAGNVTAFNTVWTYDIYQSYIRPGQPDKHYLAVGHVTTVVGILLSVACAYAATKFNNILDFLQLVFAFVNAPLFATFLLGMFWRRSTGHGAFFGLLFGTLAAAIHHGLTIPAGSAVGIHGGWLCGSSGGDTTFMLLLWAAFLAIFGLGIVHVGRGEGAGNDDLRIRLGKAALYFSPVIALWTVIIKWFPIEPRTYPSDMAQNFWTAIYAWTACFVATILISLVTTRVRTDEQLKGLVYALTPKIKDHDIPWYKQPATLGLIVLAAAVVLNFLFW